MKKLPKTGHSEQKLFYKKYDDLLKTGGAYNETFNAINNNGFGDAKGIEFFGGIKNQ